MIKLFHFITDTNIGGAGKLLCNQIKNMEGTEFETTVVIPRKSALAHELSSLPCSVIEADNCADTSFSGRSFIEDYTIIKKWRPDIVHSHGSLSSRIAATALGVPTRIFTRHCVFPLDPMMQNPLTKRVVGIANGMFSTSILAVAESARQNLIDMGCDQSRITTVINGVEPLRIIDDVEKEYLRKKYNLTNKSFVISIFARLEEYKGHRTLLEAIKICKKYYPCFRFFIVGEGSQKNPLIALSKAMKIDDTVCFLGFCNDVAPIFNITDINVNCSYGTETSSLAISEGMSLGIPCIASDYGGNSHMVKNAVNGLLFPAKNAEALANAIIRLYRDKELYKRCSLGALQRYNNEFTARAMTEKMMELYRREHAKNKK